MPDWVANKTARLERIRAAKARDLAASGGLVSYSGSQN
jgi:hypothetical protein